MQHYHTHCTQIHDLNQQWKGQQGIYHGCQLMGKSLEKNDYFWINSSLAMQHKSLNACSQKANLWVCVRHHHYSDLLVKPPSLMSHSLWFSREGAWNVWNPGNRSYLLRIGFPDSIRGSCHNYGGRRTRRGGVLVKGKQKHTDTAHKTDPEINK